MLHLLLGLNRWFLDYGCWLLLGLGVACVDVVAVVELLLVEFGLGGRGGESGFAALEENRFALLLL